MGSFVLLVVLMNFLLGFAAAVYLHDPSRFRLPGFLRRSAKPAAVEPPPEPELEGEPEPPADSEPAEPAAAQSAEPESEPIESEDPIPEGWRKVLEEAGMVARSRLEAAMRFLRVLLDPYRERLQELEDLVAAEAEHEGPPEDDAVRLPEEISKHTGMWIREIKDTAAVIAENSTVGHEIAARLEDILHDQCFQMESQNEALARAVSDFQAGASKPLQESMLRYLEFAYDLRDQLEDTLARLLREDGHLTNDLREAELVDGPTGFANRTGFSLCYDNWRKRQRKDEMGALIALDVDRFAQINEFHSTSVGDAVLRDVSVLYESLLRLDRGFDRGARVAGPTVAVLLGDTDRDGAVAAAERIRQSVAATSFQVGDFDSEITVSCAVVVIQKDDSPEQLLERMQRALREARNAGRNRTALEDHGEVSIAASDPVPVKCHTVRDGQLQVND